MSNKDILKKSYYKIRFLINDFFFSNKEKGIKLGPVISGIYQRAIENIYYSIYT